MQQMIQNIRQAVPFDTPEADLCADAKSCQVCSMKLLEFLSMELDKWQQRLDEGYVPDFGDLSMLEKSSRKVYRVLQRNHLV